MAENILSTTVTAPAQPVGATLDSLDDALLARIVVESGCAPLVTLSRDLERRRCDPPQRFGDVWHPKHLAAAACVSKCAIAAARALLLQGGRVRRR